MIESPETAPVNLRPPPGHRRAFGNRHFGLTVRPSEPPLPRLEAIAAGALGCIGIVALMIGLIQLLVALVAVAFVLLWPLITLAAGAVFIRTAHLIVERRVKIRRWYRER